MSIRFAMIRAGALGCVVLSLARCSSDEPSRKGLSGGCVVNSDCNNPLQCSFGLCHKACKETRDCPANQHCLKLPDGPVCQLAEDTVECVYSSQCPSPLKCAVDSKCRVPCEAKGDCLPSQLCTQHVCADESEIDPDTNQLPVTNKTDPWTGTDGGAGEPMDAGSGGAVNGAGGASTRPDGGGGAGGASGAGSGGKGSGGKSGGQIDAGEVVGPPSCGDAGLGAYHPSNLAASPAIPSGLIALDDLRNYFDTGNPAPNPKAPAWGTVYTPLATQQTVVKLDDGREAAVLWVASMSMPVGTKLSIKGTRPLIIASRGPVEINGTIFAEGDSLRGWFAGGAAATTTLARAGACPIDTELGGGRAGSSDGSKGSGPGGGAFCGAGGPGSTDLLMATARSAGGVPYGTKELIPLVGGSGGGSASSGNGGHGGGALQIVSGVGIVVGETGVINMAGGGSGAVGGGGSGGAILLEGPSVTIRGVLAANGGAGGDVYSGEDGPASAEPAAARGVGGPGAAGDTANGTEGNTAPTKLVAAGGGGGVGRIRINTGCGGMLVVSSNAIISPSAKTGCYTTGELR